MRGYEMFSGILLSFVFFESTAVIQNWFSSVLASSTLFLLSHTVAYFSVSCHLFKTILQSLPMLLFIAQNNIMRLQYLHL